MNADLFGPGTPPVATAQSPRAGLRRGERPAPTAEQDAACASSFAATICF
jgi:hypothetical protein